MKEGFAWFTFLVGLGMLVSLTTLEAVPLQLEKSGPITCSGDDRLTIKDRHIEARELGIQATGNCELLLQDSEVVAGGVGIEARERAIVRIEDSRITGKPSAIHAKGESRVTFKNSIITGGVLAEDEASARDLGGSLVR